MLGVSFCISQAPGETIILASLYPKTMSEFLCIPSSLPPGSGNPGQLGWFTHGSPLLVIPLGYQFNMRRIVPLICLHCSGPRLWFLFCFPRLAGSLSHKLRFSGIGKCSQDKHSFCAHLTHWFSFIRFVLEVYYSFVTSFLLWGKVLKYFDSAFLVVFSGKIGLNNLIKPSITQNLKFAIVLALSILSENLAN